MNPLLRKHHDNIMWLTLNRVDKHNALNQVLLAELEQAIFEAIDMPDIKAIVLSAKGKFFSAGADLGEMAEMAKASFEDNRAHALKLACVLELWYHCPKPTMCLIQGDVYGGALGFIAASDMAFANEEVQFCFSEAKLGLIPAVISPYVIKAIGSKACKRLFLSAETFHTNEAYRLGLIDKIVHTEDLTIQGQHYANEWAKLPQECLKSIKSWVNEIEKKPIDKSLSVFCAEKLATIRCQEPAKNLVQAFLKRHKGQ